MPVPWGKTCTLSGLTTNTCLNGQCVVVVKDEGQRLCVFLVEQNKTVRVHRSKVHPMETNVPCNAQPIATFPLHP